MTVKEQEWQSFIEQWPRQFRQGQHVTVIGPTGSGKTVLSRELVKARRLVVATGVKFRDDSLEALLSQEWHRINRWKDRPKSAERIILWPNESDIDRVQETHKRAFAEMMRDVFKRGSWCIWSDELRYLTDIVGLKKQYIQMYVTGRSNNISLVSAAQRPRHVPLEAYSQASHLFLFKTGDEADLTRMGGLNGANAKQVAQTVSQLPYHHFLHINLMNGSQTISTVKG